LAALAVPFVAVVASAQSGGAGGSVSGSATVEVGGQPTAAPPPPVVYQPAPAPAPAYGNAPPPGYAYPPPPPPPPPPGPPPGAYVHDGFYLRLAIGGGFVSASGTINSSSSVPDFTVKGGGVGFDLGIGGTVGKGIVIGGEYIFQQAVKPTVADSNGNTLGTSNANMNFGLLGPFIDWYPDPEGGFHFGGTLGLAVLTASDPNTGDTTASDTGFGGAVGVGYDFWVAPEWSLGILGKFMGGTVQNNNQTIAGVSANEKFSVGAFSLLFSVLYH
jgi:hypothetical protein